eukprot:2659171-Karenia_brevis.AAC.1
MPSREGRVYLQKINVRACGPEEVAAWLWVAMVVLSQEKLAEENSSGGPSAKQQGAGGLMATHVLDFAELRYEGLR